MVRLKFQKVNVVHQGSPRALVDDMGCVFFCNDAALQMLLVLDVEGVPR